MARVRAKKPSFKPPQFNTRSLRSSVASSQSPSTIKGTSKIEISYAIRATKNQNPLTIGIDQLPLQSYDTRMPALMALKPDDLSSMRTATMVFGIEVEHGLKDMTIKPDCVWSNLKEGHHIMDANDPVFRGKENALRDTQRQHQKALNSANKYEQITVNYPRGRRLVIRPGDPSDSARSQLDSVEDAFVIFFSCMLDFAKYQLAKISNISHAEIDNLFLSNKIRAGVAVPDVLPASSVTRYYEILVRSGFTKNTQMLSEARCAAVKVTRDFLSRDGGALALESLGQRDIDICDIGHGTTDVSTIRVAKGGAHLQFKFVVDSIGDATGGKVIEDHMIKIVRELFQKELKGCLPKISNKTEIKQQALLDGIQPNLAQAKLNFAGGNNPLSILYSGSGNLPASLITAQAVVNTGSIILPGDRLRECYDAFLKPLTPVPGGRSRKKGLLKRHYDNLEQSGCTDRNRLVFLVGGAAIPEYTQTQLNASLQKIPMAANARAIYFGKRNQAYVADGGVIMLSYTELCKRWYHNEAIGCVIQSSDVVDDINRVDWLFKVGQRIDDRTDFEQIFDYTIDFDATEEDFHYPVVFEWRFASTADEDVGKQDWPRADNEAIKLNQGIRHEMDKDLCEFIGWRKVQQQGWRHSFQFKLGIKLDGQVIHCTVTIPKGGIFGDGSGPQPTQNFEQLMTANLSHLVREDTWED